MKISDSIAEKMLNLTSENNRSFC